jgi:hypothetical protein
MHHISGSGLCGSYRYFMKHIPEAVNESQIGRTGIESSQQHAPHPGGTAL